MNKQDKAAAATQKTQDTRQKTEDGRYKRQRAVLAVPSTGKTPPTFVYVSCCSLATPYAAICWRCRCLCRSRCLCLCLCLCSSTLGLYFYAISSTWVWPAAKRTKGAVGGVAFGNCKCNHKTYHYMETGFKRPPGSMQQYFAARNNA